MLSLKNIFIFVISIGIATMLLYGSFAFGVADTVVSLSGTGDTSEVVTYQVATLEETPLADKTMVSRLSTKSYTTKTILGSGAVFQIEFGRLATAFAFANSKPSITVKNKTVSFENLKGIVSLYDPFVRYTLVPKNSNYQIQQITDGSIYISHEDDGTISLYSIDAVAELDLLDSGKKMSDLILFPGMYVRFDPADNKALQGADLYRIMLVLNSNTREDKNTGIEFINPRVGKGTGDDTFLAYRFPTETAVLFRMLHALFGARIAQVDMIKNYQTLITRSASELDHTAVYNPEKLNYFLMSDLKGILSEAVQSQKMSKDDFRARVDKVYADSKKLVADNNSVQQTLEQFLTDARFANYGGTTTKQFDDIYNETASLLGIVPDSGKGRFFQNLSDIYSKNIAQKNPTGTVMTDVYSLTAVALRQNLSNNNIATKDFFDIALYAYQILQKAQDQQKFTREMMTSPATYIFISTLLGASDKYIAGLDAQDRSNAYKTLVAQFYAPTLQSLSQSLYDTYTHMSENTIVLKGEYLDRDEVHNIPPDLRVQLGHTIQFARSTYRLASASYTSSDDHKKLDAFRDSIVRLQGFLDITTTDGYKLYKNDPFTSVDILNVSVPAVSPEGTLVNVSHITPAVVAPSPPASAESRVTPTEMLPIPL